MQNPLVALIIPIYNVKDYLKECLDSVLNQTYQNLQIILVDDASNDGSFEIAKEYFQKDLRVTLLCHKQNLGLSTARNTGLNYLSSFSSTSPISTATFYSFSSVLTSNNSNGGGADKEIDLSISKKGSFTGVDSRSDDLQTQLKFDIFSTPSLSIHSHPNAPKDPPKYIHFLDSDDYLSLDCISECVKATCKDDIDLLIYGSSNFIDPRCDLREELENGGFLGLFKNIQERKIYCGHKILEEHIKGNFVAFSVGCQIRFEIIENLRFVEGIIGEDALFAPIALSHVRSTLFLKNTFYHRRVRPLSISDFGNQHTKETLPPSLKDICQTIDNAKDVKFYYYAYSCACYCHALYIHFFLQNHFSEAVQKKINDLILDRISIAFEALHLEADPRNARAKLNNLAIYLKRIKLSSKIAYHFPRVFKALKGIKKRIKKNNIRDSKKHGSLKKP